MSASWNFTVDDTSPLLTYTPYADGSGSGLANGWIPWYTENGFLSAPGEGGAGDSYHLTSLSGASVNLKFFGTAVYLYGTSNSSYDAVIDDKRSTNAPTGSNLLFSATGLTQGAHSVTLTARPTSSQQFAFDRAVISAQYDNPPAELFYDNSDSSALKYSGNWSTQSAAGIPNATVSHPWQQTTDKVASVSMVVSNAVGVSIYGMANWGGWVYTVNVDGKESSYNGSTFWKVPDALLFYQGGLDPKKNHTVTLSNSGADVKLNVNSFRVYTTNSRVASSSSAGHSSVSSLRPSPSIDSSTNVGSASKHSSVNAGVIVGPIIAVLVLVVLGWLLWRRSKSKHKQEGEGSIDAFEKEPHRPMLPPTSYSDGGSLAYNSPATNNPVQSFTEYATSSNGTTAFSATSNSQTRITSGTEKNALAGASPVAPPVPTTTTRSPVSGLDSRDVDRLVELIAQRIDPAGHREDGLAPPEYRGM
ncbi:hypothetical protein MIND_00783000 [Mycena indigotica]|uniref:Transmembrane protein n=1 Tax=Mycena indigotica TaxID=2126181 RepID=A0A8H6W437_9AGAR|nr:uncharacterized protein MIND_00783000 [Mycena indigotica]KAF7302161.1 hypothetical protein MIND_00783000 [Mycena indigotica]